MINTIHVLLVKTTGQVKGQNHSVPRIDVDFHTRILRFISASALTKAAVVAPPEHIPITRCVEIGQRGPAIAATAKVDVVDQGILIHTISSAVGSDSVLHQITEIGVCSHIAHFHDCCRLTLYPRQFKGIGGAKLGRPCRSPIGPIQVFEIVTR